MQSLNDAATLSDENVKLAMDRANVGEVTMDVVKNAKIAAVQARSSYLDALLAASHAEWKKTDLLDKISSAKRYYQPYNDDGPYQKRLEHEGEVIGSAIFGIGGAEFGGGGAVIGALIGDFVGGMAGKAAGFYLDNLSAISKNMDTLMRGAERLSDLDWRV